jgi:hypothetical protein
VNEIATGYEEARTASGAGRLGRAGFELQELIAREPIVASAESRAIPGESLHAASETLRRGSPHQRSRCGEGEPRLGGQVPGRSVPTPQAHGSATGPPLHQFRTYGQKPSKQGVTAANPSVNQLLGGSLLQKVADSRRTWPLGAGGRWFESSRPDLFPWVYSGHMGPGSSEHIETRSEPCAYLARHVSTRGGGNSVDALQRHVAEVPSQSGGRAHLHVVHESTLVSSRKRELGTFERVDTSGDNKLRIDSGRTAAVSARAPAHVDYRRCGDEPFGSGRYG